MQSSDKNFEMQGVEIVLKQQEFQTTNKSNTYRIGNYEYYTK